MLKHLPPKRLLLALLAMTATAHGQAGGGAFRIDPVVVSGSGATLDGASFQLSGTIGQPATTLLTASGFQLQDGFWRPVAPTSDVIFANGFDP